MKILIAIIIFFIAGCASKSPIIYQKSVSPAPEIMLDCEDYLIPKDGSFEEILNKFVENKKIFELCKNQNKAKKDFIKSSQ
jgi:hypothetical protein